MLGLIRLGAIPIPGTPMLTAKDIQFRFESAEAGTLLTDAEGAAKAEGLRIPHRIIVGNERPGWTSFDAGLGQADPGFDPEPTRSSDPGIIYFTSGTTGPPKIVREDLAAYRFPLLHHCVSAGEPLNPEVFAAWKAATGLNIYDGYGQTESIILVGNFRSHKEEIRAGSMGKPTPGFTVALLDEE